MITILFALFCIWFFLFTDLGRFLAVVGLSVGLLFALVAAVAAAAR